MATQQGRHGEGDTPRLIAGGSLAYLSRFLFGTDDHLTAPPGRPDGTTLVLERREDGDFLEIGHCDQRAGANVAEKFLLSGFEPHEETQNIQEAEKFGVEVVGPVSRVDQVER